MINILYLGWTKTALGIGMGSRSWQSYYWHNVKPVVRIRGYVSGILIQVDQNRCRLTGHGKLQNTARNPDTSLTVIQGCPRFAVVDDNSKPHNARRNSKYFTT